MRTSLSCLPLLASCLGAQSATFAVQALAPLGGVATTDPTHGAVVVFESGRTWEWDGTSFRQQLGALAMTNVTAPVHAATLGGISFADGRLWNGTRWQQVAVPTGWSLGAGAYDAARQRLVRLFGSGSFDVAEWDGLQWLRITPPASPGIGSLTYDPQSRACVLATGNPVSLWTWDGVAWSQLGPIGPPSTATGFAHDPGSGALVVLGTTGSPVTPTCTAFANGAWSALPVPPEFLNAASLAWDGQGLLRVGTAREGIWRLANGAWQRLPFLQPNVRSQLALAGGPNGQGVLQFGGASGNTLFGDTWRWDGAWTRLTPTQGPSARRAAGLAWSPVDQGFLLFGGTDASGPRFDTWLWNGTDWIVQNPTTVPNAALQLVTDPSGGVLGLRPLAAGTTNDQWRWNGADWRQEPSHGAPYASAGVVAAFDPHRNVVAAAADGELWEWNGSTWSQRGFVPANYPTSFVYRPDTQRLLLVAGNGSEWDGTNWTTTTVSSSALNGYQGFATDAGRGRVFAVNSSHQPALLTTTPATASRSGYGCARGAVPGLLAAGRPTIGALGFGLTATTFAPGAPTVLAIGLQAQALHLGAGCVAWLQQPPAVHLLVADAAGRARLPLPIPNDPSLRGVTLRNQAFVVDPTRGLYADLTFSDLLQVVLGD